MYFDVYSVDDFMLAQTKVINNTVTANKTNKLRNNEYYL